MILAANWKMQIAPAEARAFAARFLARIPPRPGTDLVFFPSAVALDAAADAFAGRDDVRVGAQDIHWEPKGAFTGATSVALAAAAGATCALVGHSERRHVFGESDQDTGRKVRALLDGGLTPFLCVGELLEQRERGETEAVVQRQLEAACQGLGPDHLLRLVIAYEPVWAIGTGRNATPEDAALVHQSIRRTLEVKGGRPVPILYGGSVNRGNVRALMARPEIDGVLVGGASLDPDGWAEVVDLANEVASRERRI
ncbi:MAG TPA: triose-phosphate isomerase [Gemmatimonadales bacterium]